MRTAIGTEEDAPDPWLLSLVQERAERLDAAKSEYAEAVLAASKAGWPNTVIAKWAGRTEAAVRMYLKRKRND